MNKERERGEKGTGLWEKGEGIRRDRKSIREKEGRGRVNLVKLKEVIVCTSNKKRKAQMIDSDL